MVESGSSAVLSLQPPTHCARNKNYLKKTTNQHKTAVVGEKHEN
jgi:hypothetical protein